MIPARQALVAPRGFLANGKFTLPTAVARQLEVRSAANPDELVAVMPCGDDDVSEVVASAVKARRAWQRMQIDARAELVSRIERPLQQRFGELAVRMQRELGRAPWECERELSGLVPRLHDLISGARAQLAARAQERPRPLGVVAVLGPAMLPIATSHGAIVAALIAGNTVVWKPSPLAAASAQLYAEALQAAGLPPGVFNLVQGDERVGERLVADPDVDAVVFTGSRDHALELRRATAERLDLALILHVGTKNPAVVLEDADLERAAREIAACAFLTAGQRCTAIGRVLVEASVLEPFLVALVDAAERIPLGPGRRSLMGPMFSPGRLDAFLHELAAAEESGAFPLVKPQRRPGSLSITPSIHVVEDASAARRYLERELFGPDLAVEPVDDLADAVGRLSSGTLYATLFSESARAWQEWASSVEAGALLRNHTAVAISGRLSFAAPGREMGVRGPRALAAMTRPSALCPAPTGLALPVSLSEEVADVHAGAA
jgi:acyl-CoA reductase-like NAD-dependent aldehyde dehydrogenase